MRMHRPTAIFGSDPQALARISPSRAKDYLRSFITTVADGVPKFPALMLDIIEREDITLRQLQSVSKQVADIATTIQRQHTNVTFTAEILSLIVEVIQNHAPSVIADVSHFPPSSAHTSPRKSGMSPDSAEFSARIDPLANPILPPRSLLKTVSLLCPPSPPPTTTSNSPLNDEDTWRIPSDWDALGGGSRKLRREGAFRHSPTGMQCRQPTGVETMLLRITIQIPVRQMMGTFQQPRRPHLAVVPTDTRAGDMHHPPPTHHPASDSGLRAYLDAGYEGRATTISEQMKERKDVSGSHTPRLHLKMGTTPADPQTLPASYHMPEQTLTPEVSAKASGVNSGARSRTLPRRRPLTRAATMAHFD
ncbi:hypothetical protein EDC04DRAFT_2836640 [Pisolithus marmoratus]|nr:hypothetical protein EDC04DRAFT_2836640 [Pisolithus marmoratus]